jgi:hypothetical protein
MNFEIKIADKLYQRAYIINIGSESYETATLFLCKLQTISHTMQSYKQKYFRSIPKVISKIYRFPDLIDHSFRNYHRNINNEL